VNQPFQRVQVVPLVPQDRDHPEQSGEEEGGRREEEGGRGEEEGGRREEEGGGRREE